MTAKHDTHCQLFGSQDITLASNLPELESFLESLPEPHILFDRQYKILAANAAYRRQFGAAAPVVGRTCYEVSHGTVVPCDQAGESCPMAQSLHSGRREHVLHLHHGPRGAEHVHVELTPVRDARGDTAYFIERMERVGTDRGAQGDATLIGRAPSFVRALELVRRVGPSEATVLLLGESGTGKELFAKALHAASARKAAPLVVVDCASLPESLFESELFGHERGAFTGASSSRPGLVEAAGGGTLFLDEVGDIPLTMQVKLLRLLEHGTFRRVGSNELRRNDVRVIAATHRDLPSMMADGRFRADLYYRLSTFALHLPPLRDRMEDLPLLCDSLLARIRPAQRVRLDDAAMRRLMSHSFPGNVRELRNVLEHAALLGDGTTIDEAAIADALAAHAPGRARLDRAAPPSHGDAPGGASPAPASLKVARQGAQQAALLRALEAHRGSRAELAQKLGISQRSLYRKLRDLAGT